MPIQEVVKPSQSANVPPGDGERQKPEEKDVQLQLQELAQAKLGDPQKPGEIQPGESDEMAQAQLGSADRLSVGNHDLPPNVLKKIKQNLLKY